MATEEKRSKPYNYALETKTQQLLSTYSSTVFACDISGDTRYIKCDFPQCSEHSSTLQGKPSWILNTLKNVKTLERHVGVEVDKFMREQPLEHVLPKDTAHMQQSEQVLENGILPRGARKVLAVFNIQDPQSQLGEWIALFLKAAQVMEGKPGNDCVVITQSFVSRKELMESIARLEFLRDNSPKVEVVCVLSSHSSCQGQVFSCTPTAVSHHTGFEEFCSLHDFALACQDVLGSCLVALHISSCFTLKLDCSHAEWPVDVSWLKSKLACVLTGSSKEVYETGSQVCDLYLLLSVMLTPVAVGSFGRHMREAVRRACTEDFPDLAREMGLQAIDADSVDTHLMTEAFEDKVSPPGLVISAVHVVLLVGQSSPPSDAPSISQDLADALAANLNIRKASDVQCTYSVLTVTIDKISSLRTKSSLRGKLDGLPDSDMRFLFIALDSLLANPSTGLVDVIRTWSISRGGNKVYGLHFQNINSLQAYYVKSRLTLEGAMQDNRDGETSVEHIPSTGLVGNGDKDPQYALPVLLYMIHLAIGENGNRLTGQGIPSAVYSKKPVGCGKSSWTLEEVYMETSYVLSGLARKCVLQLLSSPASHNSPSSQTNKPGPSNSTGNKRGSNVDKTPSNSARNTGKTCVTNAGNGCSKSIGKSNINTRHPSDYTFTLSSLQPEKTSSRELPKPAFSSGVDKTFYSTGVLSRSTRTSQASAFAADEAVADSSNISENYANLALMIRQSNEAAHGDSRSGSPKEKLLGDSRSASPMEKQHGDSRSGSPKEKLLGGSRGESPKEKLLGNSRSGSPKEKLIGDSRGESPKEKLLGNSRSESPKEKLLGDSRGASPQEKLAEIKDADDVNDGDDDDIIIDTLHPLITSVTSLVDVIKDAENPEDEDNEESVLLATKSNSPGQTPNDVRRTVGQTPNDVRRTVGQTPNDVQRTVGEASYGEKTSDAELTRSPVAIATLPTKRSHKKKRGKARPAKRNVALTPDLDSSDDDEIDICSYWDQNSKGTQADFPAASMVSMPSNKDDGSNTINTDEIVSQDGISPNSPNGNNIRQQLVHSRASTRTSQCSAKELKSRTNLCLDIPLQKNVVSQQDVTKQTSLPVRSTRKRESNNNPASPDEKKSTSKAGKKHLSSKRNSKQDVSQADSQVKGVSDVVDDSVFADCNISVDVPDVFFSEGEVKSQWDKSDDLPLMANVDQVLVNHYILDLSVDFDEKVMRGSIVLFLEPANEEMTSTNFQLCLDSTLVNVESVSEVFLPDDFQIPFYGNRKSNDLSDTSDDDVYIECVKERHKVPDAVIDLTSGGEECVSSSQGPNVADESAQGAAPTSLFQRIRNSYGASKGQSESDHQAPDGNDAVSSTESSHSSLLGRLRARVNASRDSDVSKTPLGTRDVLSVSNSPAKHCTGGSDESTSTILGNSPAPGPSKRTSDDLDDAMSPRKKRKATVPSGFLDFLDDKARGPLRYKGLAYSVHGWCIRIWKEAAVGKAWPRCVWIKYHTSPEGQSLSWATDQDGRPCVFSPGAYINNRSLMPCQEPPVASSTWQAAIHVPHGCMAVMSGNPVAMETTSATRGDDRVTYQYEMDTPLPCSTLAIAVGWFESMEGRDAMCTSQDGTKQPVQCRMVAVPSVIDRASDEMLAYAPRFLEACCELLGPYPFKRLDLLILPRSFACMGLKNPNLVFLSQSILAGDGSMRLRVAHEISHAWFGLLIGAKDWTEEWLSEGFATYIEERIQAKAEQWSRDLDSPLRELRQLLRYRSLSAEMDETDENLQCLRLKNVKPSSAITAAEAVQRSSLSPGGESKPFAVVKNGQICSKKWTQVHYLKGYFLLHHMAAMVGEDAFERFLYDYVQHYQGQLVTSEDFFEFFLKKFPNLCKTVKDEFMCEWLESSGMPKCLRKRKFGDKDNRLTTEAVKQYEYWRNLDSSNKRKKQMYTKRRKQPEIEPLEHSEQIVLMLEKLIERDSILHTTLRQLNRCYNFKIRNAEIRHRWCELVVKNKFTAFLVDVKQFLTEDQGMGIYLFGELIISGQPRQRMLAEEAFAEIGQEMDRCTYQTVSDMLQGSSSSD